MADDRHYVPGDFYRICDLTGFKIRANRTKKQWNNYIVREQSFELRQPQDFVRGVRDDQSVPEPRPRQINVFLEQNTTITGGTPVYVPALGYVVAYPPRTSVFQVNNPALFVVGNLVALMQDDGTQLLGAKVTVISGSNITLSKSSTTNVSDGNIINNLSYPILTASQYPGSASGAGS